MSQWLMCVERWIHSSLRKWTEERTEDASNAAAMGLPFPALVGRYTRPGCEECGFVLQTPVSSWNASGQYFTGFVSKSTYLVCNSNQPIKTVFWTMGATTLICSMR
jgi:hypothetical protein